MLCRIPGWAGRVWRGPIPAVPGTAAWEPRPQRGSRISPGYVLSCSLPALDRESGPETGKTGLARAWITHLCFRFQHGCGAAGLLHPEGAESLVRLERDPLNPRGPGFFCLLELVPEMGPQVVGSRTYSGETSGSGREPLRLTWAWPAAAGCLLSQAGLAVFGTGLSAEPYLGRESRASCLRRWLLASNDGVLLPAGRLQPLRPQVQAL